MRLLEETLNMETLKRTLDETKTKKEFKQVLRFYDLWGRLTESKAAEHVLELACVKNGSRVLDVACGTGEMLLNLAELNPDGKNVGVDLSPDMIAKAGRKLDTTNQGHVELHTGSALALPFPDASFDVLINCYMVDLLPVETFPKVAAEFHRVLKPDAVLSMATFSFGTKWIHRFWYWAAKHFPGLLTGCRPVAFKQYLTEAGFVIEETLEVSQNTFPSQVIKARKQA